MSTASLPPYVSPSSYGRIPSYSAEPQHYEQRIAGGRHPRTRPTGQFVKQSKGGGARLRLTSQVDGVEFPVYGSGASVAGTVELAKPDGVSSVEVKLEGRLKLQEIAEGGTTSVKLCMETTLLWIKDPHNSPCPSTLPFRITLPPTFTYDGKTFPLPPTYDVKLSGLPGFYASIDYSVSAIISKPNSVSPLVPIVKSNLFGIHIGTTVVCTPLIYYPRSKPAVPLAPPLRSGRNGFLFDPHWRVFESSMKSKTSHGHDIRTKFFIPASRTFCLSHPIPFHFTIESSAHSLAAFMPYGPIANLIGKRATRIQVMRQSTVDVRNSLVLGTKTDMWRVDCIGEGSFRHAGDGPTWISFSGEIKIYDDVKITAFMAGGLSVKDCILLSMTPSEPHKCPFTELRQVVSIRLTTDPYAAHEPLDGPGEYVSTSQADSDEQLPL